MANSTEESALSTSAVGAEIEDERRAEAVRGEPPFTVNPPSGDAFGAALKDAIISALIALALAGPMVGLRTETAIGGLSLTQNWMPVAAIVAVVFFGRLFLTLFVWGRSSGIRSVAATSFRLLPSGTQLSNWKVPGLIGAIAFTIVMPFLPFADRYWMDQAIVILTYCMLGWGLNVVVGLAGLLDLGYVAFYAVGAYSFALLATNFDLGFWVCLPMAGILAAGWGLILGFPVLRLRGDYLAIVTLAFGEIIRVVIINWYDFTNGPDGISGIPRPTLFGIPFDRSDEGFAAIFGLEYSSIQRIIFLYYIILVLALITNFVTLRLRRLPVGRAWEALREDEIACRSLGINTTNTKLTAFATGAMFGGFAGSFFATRQGFISPESFTAIESFIILAVVVLGGLGSQLGIVIAVIFLNTAFEVLRELQEYRMLIVGLAMVLIMVWRPRGLISTRHPSITLKGKAKAVRAELVGEGSG
ncbi:high-affinity branched-chain amino acid ABC transporter permease LivM [Bauldia litoralis]|uniref:Amino acid/amide ABC transporter membrane protein 2, HAAT family n=1 Tax=Bauldia litoralis TaxID=665467 RepID=A0A1G6DIR6_9HYPH|nr:high-affinity branched-chain amino acid ABC transporter permease LivM [Bauldia litoralis]SDB45087.1 amino acid/amide ABC transporter membrane protein 2, HAAT family [Bauldia litoralis]